MSCVRPGAELPLSVAPRPASIKRSGLATLTLALLLVPGLTGCGSGKPTISGTLRIALSAPIRVPDPARATSPTEQFVASLLFPGLMKFSPDLHVVPELAVSIPTITAGGRTYTFTIRQDARFADGRHCTARDVAFSLSRALSPAVHSPLAPIYLGGITGARDVERGVSRRLAGVRVVDKLTLRVHLDRPDATFLQKLALPAGGVVERAASSPSLAGAGAWTVSRRTRDGLLTLVPRRHFYGGSLELRSLILVPSRNDAQAIALYRKSTVDVAHVPAESWRSLQAKQDFHKSVSLDAYYAVPHGPHRTRLETSLDRDALVASVSPALSPLTSIVPPAVPDYLSSPPDPVSHEVNTSPSVRLTMAPAGDQLSRGLRDALSRQWHVSGRGHLVTVIHAWRSLPDPVVWLRLLLPWTHSRWYRAQLARSDQLTNDPVGRMSAYGAAENWALGKAIVIPLAGSSTAYLIKPSVQNLQVTPIGIMPVNDNWSNVGVS
ncbi:MAG: ABC transporter substrate-binding protein [Chloroflexota bacterium]